MKTAAIRDERRRERREGSPLLQVIVLIHGEEGDRRVIDLRDERRGGTAASWSPASHFLITSP